MGRRKIYITPEAAINARRERQMRYHLRNSEQRNHQSLERYYKNKLGITPGSNAPYTASIP